MRVPEGNRYLRGVVRSSVRYQPLMSASVAFGLANSTVSTAGGSVWVTASLTNTGEMAAGESSAPGEPPMTELARQFAGLFGSGLKLALTGTREKPTPSAVS